MTEWIIVQFQGVLGEFSLDVDLKLPATGITALFGPSGCGKTTLLRCIAGLNDPEQGELSVKGTPWQSGRRFVPPHERSLGYVFQEANLFPHLSVRKNLLYGAARSTSLALAPDFDELVALLGIDHLLDRAPAKLSGGERQRVAIGRALLSGPELLLMDEPLAALDQLNKEEILPYLERLHARLEIPVLYVSHDLAEVERLADRMVLMEKGRVKAYGEISDLLSNPDLPFARRPAAASILDGTLTAHDDQYGLSTISVAGGEILIPGPGLPLGTPVRVRIEASDVALSRAHVPEGSSILNAPSARIVGAAPAGENRMTVFLRLGEDGTGASLLSRISRKSWDVLQLQPSDQIHTLIKGAALTERER